MYGVLGEDKSDFQTLKILVQRLADKKKVDIRGKGYTGCGELLKKGGEDLKLLSDMGCTRFIIAHDADQRDSKEVGQMLRDKIVKPLGIKKSICLLVPVQEIEAWLLADVCTDRIKADRCGCQVQTLYLSNRAMECIGNYRRIRQIIDELCAINRELLRRREAF